MAVKWTEQAALSILRSISDGPFGQDDVDHMLCVLSKAEELRPELIKVPSDPASRVEVLRKYEQKVLAFLERPMSDDLRASYIRLRDVTIPELRATLTKMDEEYPVPTYAKEQADMIQRLRWMDPNTIGPDAADMLEIAIEQANAKPIEWSPGPNLFKDWCGQYFGPDSDDQYLAEAVYNLPPMAQKFKHTQHF